MTRDPFPRDNAVSSRSGTQRDQQHSAHRSQRWLSGGGVPRWKRLPWASNNRGLSRAKCHSERAVAAIDTWPNEFACVREYGCRP